MLDRSYAPSGKIFPSACVCWQIEWTPSSEAVFNWGDIKRLHVTKLVPDDLPGLTGMSSQVSQGSRDVGPAMKLAFTKLYAVSMWPMKGKEIRGRNRTLSDAKPRLSFCR